MPFAPKADRILVKPDDVLEHVSAAGIVIAAKDGIVTSQEQWGRSGTVIAVGPGKTTRKGELLPVEVKPGDRVLFGQFQYQRIKENGETFLVMQDKDLTGVFDAA